MSQPCRTAVLVLGAVLVALASSTANASVNKFAALANASDVDAIALVENPDTPSLVSTKISTALIAQATGLLSPDQTAKLTRLPIPVVAPTYLPARFRLVRADGETGNYANGADDSGYAIDYQGENNTCLSVRSSKDSPRGLHKVRQVQTNVGLVTIYTDKSRGSKSLVSFLGIKGNPILISGGTLPNSSVSGGFKPCRAVSLETYTQVLKSLAVVK